MKQKLYFDYHRIKNTDSKNPKLIARYTLDLEDKKIYKQTPNSDGRLSENNEPVQSNAGTKELTALRESLDVGSFANVTKIKSNVPLKRFLTNKKGKFFCDESVDKAFEFQDELLNEKEKEYTLLVGE